MIIYGEEPWQILKRWWLQTGDASYIPFGDWLLHQIRLRGSIMWKCAECGKKFKYEGWFKGHLDKTGHKSPVQPEHNNTQAQPKSENHFTFVGLKLTVAGKDYSYEEFMQLYDEMTRTRNLLKAATEIKEKE